MKKITYLFILLFYCSIYGQSNNISFFKDGEFLLDSLTISGETHKNDEFPVPPYIYAKLYAWSCDVDYYEQNYTFTDCTPYQSTSCLYIAVNPYS